MAIHHTRYTHCPVPFDSQLMTSAEAWRLSKSRNSTPLDVAFCEDLVDELSNYISRIPPEVRNVVCMVRIFRS